MDFIVDLTSTTNPVWVDLHFRDHSALEKIREYSTTVQDNYHPYSIGYYAVDTDGSFQSVFNGKNPNGDFFKVGIEKPIDNKEDTIKEINLFLLSKIAAGYAIPVLENVRLKQ